MAPKKPEEPGRKPNVASNKNQTRAKTSSRSSAVSSDAGKAPKAGKSSKSTRQPVDLEIYALPSHLIRRLHQSALATVEASIAESGYDLTIGQFEALSTIAAQPGLDQASLATLIAFDRATTGGLVDRLEEKGLVRRRVDESDRRARKLSLEARGKRVLERVTPLIRKAQKQIFQQLPVKDRPQFVDFLTRLHDASQEKRFG